MVTRRVFLKTSILFGSIALGGGISLATGRKEIPVVRPPGAKRERDFYKSCIRCFQCGSICPNTAIRFMGLEGGASNLFTPYIVPRDQACILCMKCTHVCPTDALEKIPDDKEVILERVKMGVARVDTSICFSYNGRTCGVCYYACPYPDVALSLLVFARPVVHYDKCVGCGACERACIHIPQAIRVYPEEREKHAKKN